MNKDALYVVHTPWSKSGVFRGLAVQLQEWPTTEKLAQDEKSIAYHDTCRGHMQIGKFHEAEDGTVTLHSRNFEEGPFIFKPCTIEMFKRKYFNLAYKGEDIAAICQTTDDLWEYYRRRFDEEFM